jgi:uncharacterized coiled-coil protein SlyX
MNDVLPDCMMGPSEPCVGFTQMQAAKDARIAELEAQLASTQTVRKMNAAVADLALANTDSWKSRAEQAEAQLAKAEAERLFQSVKAAELEAQLAVMREALKRIAALGGSTKKLHTLAAEIARAAPQQTSPEK